VAVCEDCGTEGRLEFDGITRHHLTYLLDDDELDAPDNITLLCWECHQARHRDNPFDEYWRDCEEMHGFYSYWCSEMSKS
jgi:hypothetical protein